MSKQVSVILFLGLLLNSLVFAHEEKKRSPIAIELDEVLIEGDIQKPEAYFILQHRNFDALLNSETQPKFDALGLILESVANEIF